MLISLFILKILSAERNDKVANMDSFKIYTKGLVRSIKNEDYY